MRGDRAPCPHRNSPSSLPGFPPRDISRVSAVEALYRFGITDELEPPRAARTDGIAASQIRTRTTDRVRVFLRAIDHRESCRSRGADFHEVLWHHHVSLPHVNHHEIRAGVDHGVPGSLAHHRIGLGSRYGPRSGPDLVRCHGALGSKGGIKPDGVLRACNLVTDSWTCCDPLHIGPGGHLPPGLLSESSFRRRARS